MTRPKTWESVWPIQRTGSAENERIQINNALKFLWDNLQGLKNEVVRVENIETEIVRALELIIPEGVPSPQPDPEIDPIPPEPQLWSS